LLSVKSAFFKENVRYPVWICREPISLILGTRFEILGTQIGSENALKNPGKIILEGILIVSYLKMIN